jgi:hypothetical protein
VTDSPTTRPRTVGKKNPSKRVGAKTIWDSLNRLSLISTMQ